MASKGCNVINREVMSRLLVKYFFVSCIGEVEANVLMDASTRVIV